MGTVFARDTMAVAWSEGDTMLRKGEPFDSGHPLVRERPDLFTDAQSDDMVAGRGARRIENTMRSPGGRRGGKRGGGR